MDKRYNRMEVIWHLKSDLIHLNFISDIVSMVDYIYEANSI